MRLRSPAGANWKNLVAGNLVTSTKVAFQKMSPGPFFKKKDDQQVFPNCFKKHLTQHSEGVPSPKSPGIFPGESRDESQVGEPSGGNAHGFGGDGWEKI